MIIGILGAIAIPRLSRGSEGAGIHAFVNEINNFAKTIDFYQLETGGTVSDSGTGEFPQELKGYLHANSWEGSTPLGGEWDIERNENGVGLAVGVHYQKETPDEDALSRVDEIIDDGDLDTGVFRKIGSGRYYLILETPRVSQGDSGTPIVNAVSDPVATLLNP